MGIPMTKNEALNFAIAAVHERTGNDATMARAAAKIHGLDTEWGEGGQTLRQVIEAYDAQDAHARQIIEILQSLKD